MFEKNTILQMNIWWTRVFLDLQVKQFNRDQLMIKSEKVTCSGNILLEEESLHRGEPHIVS